MSKKDKEKTNKFLTEAMGKCWHTFECIDFEYKCKCGTTSTGPVVSHLDFFTWEGFGKLWKWASKQSWWQSFKSEYKKKMKRKHLICYTLNHISEDLINPKTFAKEISEFLKTETI